MWSGADASYLAAITAAAREYSWHGTVTDADGATYSYGAGDIVKGSGQITRQVSSPTALEIGTVYASQLSIRLFKNINRFKLYGGTIDLYCDVDVGGVTYSVPMGVYNISSCTQEINCINITAYDNMVKLDGVQMSNNLEQDTPYNWLSMICSSAGVTLATTQADIEAMPNGTYALDFHKCEVGFSELSCRDALSLLCMGLCANAYCNRDGEIVIQNYSSTATDNIAASDRFSSSFSDYTTYFRQVTLGFWQTKTISEFHRPMYDGLRIDLGYNPFFQYSLGLVRQDICRDVLNGLRNINYEPYSVTMPLRPELDPMDVLTFSGNQASTDIGAITMIVYKLGGAMTVKCSGTDPRVASAKSSDSKAITALVNSESETDFYTYYFENGQILSFSDNETTVASIVAQTINSARLTMLYTVNLNVTQDGSCYLLVYLNGTVYRTYHTNITQGDNLLNFHVSFNLTNPQYNYIYVKMYTDGGLAFDTDGTWDAMMPFTWNQMSDFTWTQVETPGQYSFNAPTATIQVNMSMLTIFGRGLAATEVWDGNISCEDQIPGVSIPDIYDIVGPMTDTATLTDDTPISDSMSDSVPALLNNLTYIGSMSDGGEVFSTGFMYYNAYINTSGITTTGVTLTSGVWHGSGEIDDGTNGYLTITDEIATSGITQITAVDTGGYWQLSFDSGVTWEGYSGGSWSTDTIMTTAQLGALDSTILNAKGATMQIRVLLEQNTTATSVTVEGGTL